MVDLMRRFDPWLALVFLAMLADLVSTEWRLSVDPIAREGNPLITHVAVRWGLKVMSFAVFALVYRKLEKKNAMRAAHRLALGVTVFLFVIAAINVVGGF